MGDVNMINEQIGQNLVFYAAARQGLAAQHMSLILQLLIETHGVSATLMDKLMNQTALFYAARQGCANGCAYLIEKACDPNHADRHTQTALFYAAKAGHESCIELLISRGAIADPVDHRGQSPLFYTVSEGYAAGTRTLLRH